MPDSLLFGPAHRSRARKQGTDEKRILEVMKRAATAVGIDPHSIWTHCLRKSFRKVLYASGIDSDMAEAIMWHKLSGSRGNYFDFHDVDEIAANYMKANFSRATTQITEEAWKEIRRQQLRRDMKEL